MGAAVGADHRGVVVPGARAGLGPGAGGGHRRHRSPGRARSTGSRARSPTARAGWCCATSPEAGRSPPTRLPRRPPAILSRPKTAAHPGAGRDARDRLPAARLATGDLADPRRLRRVRRPDPRRARAHRVRAVPVRRHDLPDHPLFERVFGLSGLDALPDPSRFDPTPEDEQDLRERLLKAGDQRARSGGELVDIPADIAGFSDHRRQSRLRALTRLSRG